MSIQTYILDDVGNPVMEPDIGKWGAWMGESRDQRRVARDTIGDILVSTVFLGLDHRFGDEGLPILWETMIFGGELDQYQDRHVSRNDAIAGHKHAMWLVDNPDAVETD